MSFERPDFTREFLAANPQVAYALFQAMLMMNIVDPNIITVKYSKCCSIESTGVIIS